MDYMLVLIILSTLSLLAIGVILGFFLFSDNRRETLIFSITYTLISVVGLNIIFVGLALSHGATLEMIAEDGVISTIKHYDNSPTFQNLDVKTLDENDSLDETIVAFYKFNCPDCTALYSEMKDVLERYCSENNKRLYWVSNKSEYGNDLAMKYKIKWVPSVLIHDENDLVIKCGEADENGEPIFYDEFKTYFSDYR